MEPLLHKYGDECHCEAEEQAGEPQPVHPNVRGSGNEDDGGVQRGRTNGVGRGTIDDSALNED